MFLIIFMLINHFFNQKTVLALNSTINRKLKKRWHAVLMDNVTKTDRWECN